MHVVHGLISACLMCRLSHVSVQLSLSDRHLGKVLLTEDINGRKLALNNGELAVNQLRLLTN